MNYQRGWARGRIASRARSFSFAHHGSGNSDVWWQQFQRWTECVAAPRLLLLGCPGKSAWGWVVSRIWKGVTKWSAPRIEGTLELRLCLPAKCMTCHSMKGIRRRRKTVVMTACYEENEAGFQGEPRSRSRAFVQQQWSRSLPLARQESGNGSKSPQRGLCQNASADDIGMLSSISGNALDGQR